MKMLFRLAEPLGTHPAGMKPPSLNESARTVVVTFATENPIVRLDPYERQSIREKLLMSGCDLSEMTGAPVLDSHETGTVASILGVVTAARISGTTAIATVKFGVSEAAELAFQAVKAGVLRGCSVGYEIHESRLAKVQTPNEPSMIEITKWKPKEISLVALPADTQCGMRNTKGLVTRGLNNNAVDNSTPALKARAATGDSVAAAILAERNAALATTTRALEAKILNNFCKAQTQ